jgi:predicted CxxxxCH...CXXCH cytochrome family protein
MDSNLPAKVVFSGNAAHGGGRASPAYDHSSMTCSNVGCHGGHLDGGEAKTSPWSSADAPIACGGCHGLPPKLTREGRGTHLPTGPADCGACHRTAEGQPISIFTEAITEAGKAEHINGCVDLTAGCAP